jgi:aquaporin Z
MYTEQDETLQSFAEFNSEAINDSKEKSCKADSSEYTLVQKLLAEFFGTALLVFATLSAFIFSSSFFNQVGAVSAPLHPAVLTGLSLVAALLIFGRVSQGYFNPAVTVASLIARKVSVVEGLGYLVSQVVGGIFAVLVLYLTLPQKVTYMSQYTLDKKSYLTLAQNGYGSATPLGSFYNSVGADMSGNFNFTYTVVSVFVAEFIFTAILVAVILGLSNVCGKNAAAKYLGAGATLALVVYLAEPITSAGLNPARSIGIALFTNNGFNIQSSTLLQLWLYIVAPILAGVVVGAIYVAVSNLGLFDKSEAVEQDVDAISIEEGEAGADVIVEESVSVVENADSATQL